MEELLVLKVMLVLSGISFLTVTYLYIREEFIAKPTVPIRLALTQKEKALHSAGKDLNPREPEKTPLNSTSFSPRRLDRMDPEKLIRKDMGYTYMEKDLSFAPERILGREIDEMTHEFLMEAAHEFQSQSPVM